MLRISFRRAARPTKAITTSQTRAVNMAAMVEAPQTKREGDISDSFASMAGVEVKPLPDQFRQIKLALVEGREDKIKASWNHLLKKLLVENEVIANKGSDVIPEIRFSHLDEDLHTARRELKKRGAAVVRGVIPEDEARAFKFDIEDYVRKNPSTHGRRSIRIPLPDRLFHPTN